MPETEVECSSHSDSNVLVDGEEEGLSVTDRLLDPLANDVVEGLPDLLPVGLMVTVLLELPDVLGDAVLLGDAESDGEPLGLELADALRVPEVEGEAETDGVDSTLWLPVWLPLPVDDAGPETDGDDVRLANRDLLGEDVRSGTRVWLPVPD